MNAAADDQDNNGSERNLTLAAYDGLLTQIISGELPGGTIIEERALLPVLGVSRTPLREALGRLQGEGFLVRQRRKLVVHQVTDRDFIEILHLRRILEAEAVALAASRISQELTGQIRAALMSLKTPGEHSPEDHWRVDDFLHRTIAEASGNTRLARIIIDLRQKTKPVSLKLLVERNYPSLDFDEHMAILAALENRDAEQARRAMTAHIESARDNIVRKLAEF